MMRVIAVNHDDMVRMTAEALSGSPQVKAMMTMAAGSINRALVKRDGEGVGVELSVLDVASSLVTESLMSASADLDDQFVLAAHAPSSEYGKQKISEFFDALTTGLSEVLGEVGDTDAAVLEWLQLEGS